MTHNEEFLNKTYFKLTTNTCGCKRCINYQDVWENPLISSDNGGKNNNRYLGRTGKHKGIDILTGETYKEVHSLLCGEVVFIETSFSTNQYGFKKLGNVVTVKSKDKKGDTIFIMYCHLDEVYVEREDKVVHGQKLALSGSTGNAAEILNEDGELIKGIWKKNWHVHIETATTYANAATMYGQSRKNPELFMKTKFDENDN